MLYIYIYIYIYISNWWLGKEYSTSTTFGILEKTHGMQHYNIPMGNAWTHENMLKSRFKMPQGANIDTHKINGTQPNQNFEKICPKTKFLTPFTKNPQFKNPKLISTYSKKKMKRMLRKHTLNLFLQKISFKIMGFRETLIWVERCSREAMRGK